MYQKILVPLDGSATAERGFQEALKLAKVVNASLVLLHVVDPYPVVTGLELASADTWQQITQGLRAHGKSVLDQAHQTATAAGVASSSTLAESGAGRVADAIVETTTSMLCDLIVMGTHGRRGWSHLALGSDAERVSRLSPVPLLLVRQPEDSKA